AAGRGGGAYQDGPPGPLTGRHLPGGGRGRVSRALEPPGAAPGNVGDSRGCAAGAASHRVGGARRLPVGRRQHAHGLRDQRHRAEHRVPAVEREQPARHPVGRGLLQRIARRRLDAVARRPGGRGSGGLSGLVTQLSAARDVLFWLMLGGFVWVLGDLFQQYAAKYVGISRGIPLSNTNQLWGLAWGLLVFGELRGHAAATYGQVIG